MTQNERAAIDLLRTRGTRVVEAVDGSVEIIGAVRGYVWMRADVWKQLQETIAWRSSP